MHTTYLEAMVTPINVIHNDLEIMRIEADIQKKIDDAREAERKNKQR